MTIKNEILAAINAVLKGRRLSDRKASLYATGVPDTIRNIRRGSFPRLETLEVIFDAFDIEFHISRPQYYTEATGKPVSEDQASAVDYLSPLSLDIQEDYPVGYNEKDWIQVSFLDASMTEKKCRPLYFRKDWLIEQNLNFKDLKIIRVDDQSMSPVITKDDVLLVNCLQTRPGRDRIMVVQKGNILTVRKLVKIDNTRPVVWMLVSGSANYSTRMLNNSDQLVGEVVWRGGTL